MRKIWIAAIFGLLALTGCAQVPTFSQAAQPAASQETARIVVYRWLEPYESLEFAKIDLDGKTIGYAQNGAVFYRDVAPGQHVLQVVSRGQYYGQTQTITLTPGETLYARIASLSTWRPFLGETFDIRFSPPAIGASDVASLPLVSGWGWSPLSNRY